MSERTWSGTMSPMDDPSADAPAEQEVPQVTQPPAETIRRKADMVEQMIEQSEGQLNEETAAIAYKVFTDSVIKFIEDGETVQISGFGKFFNRVRAPRMSTNPETKEPIQVPAKRVPIFKAGKNLKQASSF